MGAYYNVPLVVWRVIWGSCSQQMEKQGLERKRVELLQQKVRTLVKSVDTKTPKPPFEWSPSEKKQFLDRLKTLKQGNNLGEVVKLLGPPYRAEIHGPKETPEPTGIFVEYYLKKNGDESNIYHDQTIAIDFDNDGKLNSVLTNIKGLEKKVGPLVKVVLGGAQRGAELENLDEPNDPQ